MTTEWFQWIIGGLVLIFGVGFSALWVLQLRMEERLTKSMNDTTKALSEWIKKHISDDAVVHTGIEKTAAEVAKDLHASEMRNLNTFATKNDLDRITTHVDGGFRDVNARLDLVLMNMTPGKQ
jgi:hypothetical protein